ncbi:hypothetical protein SUGI_1088470 [Cryptomeria japonica]|uniref:two-component response regulator-like PRR1 n=1 Tax=Cryptomeria japonica TaxID=3369 RepID=UPI0024149036|nr:two-component response regulator-like PRR1 [Cryptomeria japonica]XP_057812953.2 two-component response regulator-like PRR1 [Cryptomeria japonica]XP_057812954.2 two-component response regulator-like PRR1 [Cryptomeria japonica]GLJ51134.1 hypothetical protein SUGI_1088470 [Cryptomeria japonica]
MAQGDAANGDRTSPVLDRSRVRILLCDKDPKNSQQVLELLQNCSYQVTAVNTARQVIGVLNAESQEIDLILAEVDLPKDKGFKMLKHIMREEHLRRIPIVMMSSQDEVTIVMKCLKLGAADYLVKPLRINELLNLWIHMWRRRRMLGLAEKNVIGRNLNHDFDLLASDPSESNTNSNTLFSDDTDDKKLRSCTGPETSTLATPPECQSKNSPMLELSLKHSSDFQFEAPQPGPLAGRFSSYPKKSEFKIGESSAFLAYVKASIQAKKTPNLCSVGEEKSCQQELPVPQNHSKVCASSTGANSSSPLKSLEAVKTSSQSNEVRCRDGLELRSTNLSVPPKIVNGEEAAGEQFSVGQSGVQNEGHGHVNGLDVSSLAPSQFVTEMMNCSPMSAPMQLCHGVPHNVRGHINPGMIPFHMMPPCHGMPVNAALSYYSFGLHLGPAQLGHSHAWPSLANVSVAEPKISQMERREAALNKFRQKRKDRCFDKKIRYVSRKRLAEQRPRIRGQFVRQTNDTEIGARGVLDDSEDEDDEYGRDFSPETLARVSQNANHRSYRAQI